MAFTRVSPGDTVRADDINDIQKALDGAVGGAQAISLVELDDAANYALNVRNKDGTNSLIARFRNAANEVVLGVVKEALTTVKQIISGVADGTAPFVVTSTTKVDNLHVARATLADTIADGSVTTAKIGDDQVTTAKIADLNVTNDKLAAGSVGASKIGNSQVTADKIGAGQVTAGKIADGGVDTTARLANDIVDDTKVGNRVPQFYRRQGGSATDWNTFGTTTYTPTAVRMQVGSVLVGDDISETYKTITFPTAFSNKPVVYLQQVGGFIAHGMPVLITATNFRLDQTALDGKADHLIRTWLWYAIGPE